MKDENKTKKQIINELRELRERISELGVIESESRLIEEKLSESKVTLQYLFESITDFIFILDENGIILGNNPSVNLRSGYTKEEVVGNSLNWFFTPASKKIFAREFPIVKKEGVNRAEVEFVCKNGTIINEDCSTTAIHDDQGDIEYIIAFHRDITKRKKVEKELIFKNTLLEAQFETTLDGILVVNNVGKSIFFNKRFGEMWNIPSDMLKRRDDNEMHNYVLDQIKYPKEYIDKVKYLYDHEDEKSMCEIEFKDGKTFDRWSAPLRDKEGLYHGRIWYFRDITGRKLAEEATKKARDDYLAITNLTGDIIVNIDKEGMWTFLNDGACQFWEKQREELMGCAFIDYLHPDDKEETIISIQKMIESKNIVKGHVNRQKSPKGWRTVEWNAFPLYDESGNYTGMQVTGRDVTERNKVEKKLKKAARTDLLTGLSNRRDFTEKFKNEMSRFKRNNKPFSIAMGDIDFFKRINDTYGHDCGDYVLRKMARLLKASLRKQDVVGRWGGEEFIILLPETDLNGGEITAEKIRRKISTSTFSYKGHKFNITMSFGVCVFDSIMSIEKVINKADESLYKAKTSGRNRVISNIL